MEIVKEEERKRTKMKKIIMREAYETWNSTDSKLSF